MATEAPVAPPSAPPSPPPSAPPSAPASPKPTTVLHVDGKGAIDKGPPPEPPKKGSAMDQMRKELQKKAQPTNAPDPKPKEPDSPKPGESPETPEEGVDPNAPPAEPAPAGEKGKKVSPWKLVEEHKAARANLEKELLELKKAIPDPKEKEKITAEIESIRKRNAELEEEIRYTNYSKSKEFNDKYQQPYEQAWNKAMADLSELTVMDEAAGTERPLSPADMLSLVNMPLKDARAKAVDMFGDFADDVMAHRKEIRSLFEAQNKALDEARKSGAEREQSMKKAIEEFRTKSQQEVMAAWEKANQEALADEKIAHYFKPIEGDEEGNKRLQRGYELADKALSTPDPRDPRLKPEQRDEIIRLHTAMRHRAAAFGRVSYQLQQASEKIKSLEAELNKYRGSEPGSGEGPKPGTQEHHSSARESVFAALRQRAH